MLIFLDLETTGLEDIDKICSIAIIVVDGEKITSFYELVDEGKKIPSKASSINHLTNEMIKGKPKLKDTKIFKFLNENNNTQTTIIGHNINFDLNKLSACGFDFQGIIIDTLRVSKHLVPECESYSLEFLRYDFKLYKDENSHAMACGIDSLIVSHNALSDALVINLLYNYLLKLASKEKLNELSFKNVLLQKLDFGKYSGRYIEDIAINDRSYLLWMLSLADLDEDLRYSIDFYITP